MTSTLILHDVLLARAWITKPFEGKPQRDGKILPPKFRIEVILPLDHPQLPALKAAQRFAAEKKFGSEAQQKLLVAETQDKLPIHKGDVTRAGNAEYAGKLYLVASNKEQPTVVITGENGVNQDSRADSLVVNPSNPKWPYAGCRVNVQLDFFAYHNEGTGVSCTVRGVQFKSHGKKIGGSFVSTASEFGVVTSEADSAAPAQRTDSLV
jgi:hypothetical protein